jgi:hypothetical protein
LSLATFLGRFNLIWREIKMKLPLILIVLVALSSLAFAGDNLKLNPKLDYSSDSQDGPLITGDNMEAGFVPGKPAYVILYGEGCYNSKRQARRTVELYGKFQGRVQFVIVDLDRPLARSQSELKKKYYAGYIPHVVVLNPSGSPLYNSSGEVDSSRISDLLDKALR